MGPELRVSLDQARSLQLPAGAAGVVIGNPSIAGVTVQTDRLLFITGRSYGSTNLIVVGPNGRQLYQGRITVVADETDALMLNKGGWVSRYDCTPVCRRRPDISEDPQAFTQTTTQIQARQSMSAQR
jgi:Pilus formation protein N terminal region